MVGPRERAMLLSDAAGVLRQLKRLEEAVSLYSRSLEVLTVFGPNFMPTSTVHNNMGAACLEIGDDSGAFRHFLLARAIRERNLGPLHPGTLQCDENIAIAHMQAGDPAIATALRKKVRSAYAAAAKAASRATPPRQQAKNTRTSEQVLIGPADPRRAA